jgi:hypothetical protein
MKVEIGEYTDEGQDIQITIHDYDVWSMDSTLALIIVPMLKKLKELQHGHPGELTKESWNEKLDEMIWAFEQKLENWEGQYIIQQGEIDWDSTEKDEAGNGIVRWSREHVVDRDGREAHQARMTNGFKLFGEWYEHLWD